MLEAILLLAVIVMAIILQDTRQRLKQAEQRLHGLLLPEESDRPAASASPSPARQPAPATEEVIVEAGHRAQADEPAPSDSLSQASDAQRPSASQRFESFVGGRLPIWIGGIALAFAGFFLVRYSIELGLFGPGARSLMAAGFGLALVALSEFGARFPRLGGFVASDRRIPQSLAGAGIATLYGTLYMAAELYGLVGIGIAFVLVVAVTILALALSLRHGPPTAVMGLAGGYLAPLVAGLPDSSLTSTLLYLGVFTLGLTGLAIWRRWAWLAFAASMASLVWTGSLLLSAERQELWGIGALVAVIVIASALAMARIGRDAAKLWNIRSDAYPVMSIGFGILQLVSLAAMADYSPLSWLLLAALAVTTVALVFLRQLPIVAVWIAFALAMLALAGSFAGMDPTVATLLPAVGLAVLFAAPALVAVYRKSDDARWAMIAIAAVIAPLFVAMAFFAPFTQDFGWAAACLITAIPVYAILHLTQEDVSRVLALVALLLLGGVFIVFALPVSFYALGYALLFAGFVFWRRQESGNPVGLSLALLGVVAVVMLVRSAELAAIPFATIAGDMLHYDSIPTIRALVLNLALPALAVTAAARRIAMPARLDAVAITVAGLGLLGFAYAVLKQPLAIAAPIDFLDFGFIERALLTQGLFIAGLWMASRRSTLDLHRLGLVACGIALARFIWFDLLLLNPVSVEQAVGPTPVANMATLHSAAIAVECWLLARFVAAREAGARLVPLCRYASLAAMVVAVLVTVRQGVHGSIIAGPDITTAENYMYSVALLLLALAWLAIGIRQALALLRVAGLVLLIVVTFKVFLVDAAALSGLLRVLSFLGLGAALIGIGWAYGKLAKADAAAS